MSLSTKNKWFLGLGIAALAGGCIWVGAQLKKTYDAIYTIAGIIVKNISLSDINFTLLLKIENKGGIGVDIVGESYDVFVNKMFVTHIDYPSKEQLTACAALSTGADRAACINKFNTHIPHNSSATAPINVQFNPQDKLKAGLQNLGAIISNQKSIVITIKGKFIFYVDGLRMPDFNFEETLTLEDIIKNSVQIKG